MAVIQVLLLLLLNTLYGIWLCMLVYQQHYCVKNTFETIELINCYIQSFVICVSCVHYAFFYSSLSRYTAMQSKKVTFLCTVSLVFSFIAYCWYVPTQMNHHFILEIIHNVSIQNKHSQNVHNPIPMTFVNRTLSLDTIHNLPNVVIDNGTKQTVHHIISAYYDSRKLPQRPAVIMFGYVEKRIQGDIYCAAVYDDNTTKCLGNVLHGPLHSPHVLSELYFCKLSWEDKIPTHVILTERDNCEISNQSKPISVWNRERTQKYDIGVCVESPLFTGSGVTQQEIFDSLVEFMAMVKVLGAKIVTVYNCNITQELIIEVLKLYPDFIDLVQWTNLTVNLHYCGQNVMLYDCLYRNMNRVKYLAFIDMDEIIFPVSTNTWMDMMKVLEKKGKYASYIFQTTSLLKLQGMHQS